MSSSDTEAASSSPDKSEKSSASESDEPKHMDLHDIVECLVRSALRHPLNFDHVVASLANLAARGYDGMIMKSVMRIIDSSNVRRSHRLIIYDAVSRSLITPAWDPKRLKLSPTSVKSFVVRMINDVDKSSALDSESTLACLSKLVASLSLCAFRDLVVGVLMTAEFVSGKPTVSTALVTSALVELFSDLISAEELGPHINDLIVRVDQVLSLKHNNELITAVMKSVLRTKSVGRLNCRGSLFALFSWVTDQAVTPESLETAVYVMAVLQSDTPLEHKETLEGQIMDLGLKKSDEKIFTEIISVIWKFGVNLFTTDQSQEDLMALLLSCSVTDVWAFGPDEMVTQFLCSKGDAPEALLALRTVAASRKHGLGAAVVRLIDTELVGDESVPSSSESIVATFWLISALDESLVSPLMTAFVLRFVCAPATAVAKRFPSGIIDSDLAAIRAESRACLFELSKKSTGIRAHDFLLNLLECLEHMPSVGLATVCECVTVLRNRAGEGPKLAQSQSFLILTWLLIQVGSRCNEEPVESVIACLVAISGLIHPSIDNLWDPPGRLLALAAGTGDVGGEFAYAANSIEFSSRDERGKYFNVGLETVVVLLSTGSCTARVKEQLIAIWEQIMHIIVPDQSVAVFAQRCVELLALRDAVAASAGTVAASGRAVGRLADRRLDAIADLIVRTHTSAQAELLSLGGGNGSVADSLRLLANKSSFRGLFVFESTERKIGVQLRLKETALIAAGYAVEVCDDNRLSDLRVKDLVTQLVLDELKRDTALLRNWLERVPRKEDTLLLETMVAAIHSLQLVSARLGRAEGVDVVFYEKFQTDAVSLLLELLGLVGLLPESFPTEDILEALAALVGSHKISTNHFGETLETTLQCLVHAVPDAAAAVSAAALSRRSQAAARVVKALFRHANSWMGFSSLVKAVFALGGNGPLPLMRWACLRIVRELVDDTEVVGSERDVVDFLDTVAVVLPRTSDSYAPVRDLAVTVMHDLLLRCEFTKDLGGVKPEALPGRLAQAVPDQHVPTLALLVIPTVHDADAADSVVNFLHLLLSTRTLVFSPEEVAADAVVDAILSNAAFVPPRDSPIPPLSATTRMRLVATLKFLAAVRFPIAITEVLQPAAAGPGSLSGDSVHALQAFAREKTTLLFLAKELIDRINRADSDAALTGAMAMGHVLDCYDDTGVAAVASKYSGEIFSSLLMLMWRQPERLEELRLVVHKLGRAAGLARLSDSITADTGLLQLLRNEENLRSQSGDFLLPFFQLEVGSKLRTAALVLASQLVGVDAHTDAKFLDHLFTVVTDNEGPSELLFGLKGIAAVVQRSRTEPDAQKSLLLFAQHAASADAGVVMAALHGIYVVGETAKGSKSSALTATLMSTALAQLRRVVDHTDSRIKAQSFKAIRVICECVSVAKAVENSDQDQTIVGQFFSSASDLWIPCLLRSRDESVCEEAVAALVALLNAAVSDSPVSVSQSPDLSVLLALVKTEICETSLQHLHSVSYYLLGLPSVGTHVAVAAARLVPVLIHLLPGPSKEAAAVVDDVLEKLLALSLIHKEIEPLLADVVVEGKRVSVDMET